MTFYKRKVGGIIQTWDKLGSGYPIKTDTSVACVSLPYVQRKEIIEIIQIEFGNLARKGILTYT